MIQWLSTFTKSYNKHHNFGTFYPQKKPYQFPFSPALPAAGNQQSTSCSVGLPILDISCTCTHNYGGFCDWLLSFSMSNSPVSLGVRRPGSHGPCTAGENRRRPLPLQQLRAPAEMPALAGSEPPITARQLVMGEVSSGLPALQSSP